MFNFEQHYIQSITKIKKQAKEGILDSYEKDFQKDTFVKMVADEVYRYITENRATGIKYKLTAFFFPKSDEIPNFTFPKFQNGYLNQLLSEKTKETFKTNTGFQKLTEFSAVIALLDIKNFSSAFELIEKFENFTKEAEEQEIGNLEKKMRAGLLLAKTLINFEKVQAEIDEEMKNVETTYEEKKKAVNTEIKTKWEGSKAWKILSAESTKKQLEKIMSGEIQSDSTDTDLDLDSMMAVINLGEKLQNLENELAAIQQKDKENYLAGRPPEFTQKFDDSLSKGVEELKKELKISQEFNEEKYYPLGSTQVKGSDIKFLNSILEKNGTRQTLSAQDVIDVLRILDNKIYIKLINTIESILPTILAQKPAVPTISFG